jgi:chromosome segregation ATPase
VHDLKENTSQNTNEINNIKDDISQLQKDVREKSDNISRNTDDINNIKDDVSKK